MQRTILILKCVASAFFGLVGGYLIGVVAVGLLKVIPFLRVGNFEIRGNLPGIALGAVLGALSARSTYKAQIRKLTDGRKLETSKPNPNKT